MADEVREAEVRNTERWSSYAPRYGGFQGEIDHLKQWLETRCNWVDDQFVKPPEVQPEDNHADSAGIVTFDNPNGYGTIYYTLDGSDPRTPVYAATVQETATLVTENAAKRVLVPTGAVADTWHGGGAFDDSAWTAGTGGVGYERSTGYEQFFDIDVSQMYNRNASCYIRIPFTLDEDPANFNFMLLNMRYDDGFVAYLNGVEIQRGAFTGTPTWNASASANHDDMAAIQFEEFDVSAYSGLLKQGQNILAIHGLNSSTTSSDALFSAELIAGTSTNPDGDGIADTAFVYDGPIVLAESTPIKARVLVGSNPYSPWSGLAEPVISVGPVAESLRISEIMYHPSETGRPEDPNTEYVELTNVGSETINLNLVAFTDGIDFVFPSTELAPGDFVLVVRDIAAFEAKYGPGLPVAGQYDGSLANGGEHVELQDAAGQTIHSFGYSDNWYDLTDGLGFSLTVRTPAALDDPNTLEAKGAWRPSVNAEGSPGYDDGGDATALGAIVINEIMADALLGGPDWIELYNTTDQAIDIGGWFLSDTTDDLTKYEIADGTVLPADGYIVLNRDEHFGAIRDPGCHVPFGLTGDGEAVYLHSGTGGALTGYCDEEQYDACETGVTLGRYRKSTGTYNFVAQSRPTPGQANGEPAVGPIVINEVMVHPATLADAQYVELLNIDDEPITLFDDTVRQPWRFTSDSGIECLLSGDEPITVAPGACLVLTKNTIAFDLLYALPANVPILEWGGGRLSQAGDRIQLSKPGSPNTDEDSRWIRVDRLVFTDEAPWPVAGVGQGGSLQRIDPTEYGNDPANWQVAIPSPGLSN